MIVKREDGKPLTVGDLKVGDVVNGLRYRTDSQENPCLNDKYIFPDQLNAMLLTAKVERKAEPVVFEADLFAGNRDDHWIKLGFSADVLSRLAIGQRVKVTVEAVEE